MLLLDRSRTEVAVPRSIAAVRAQEQLDGGMGSLLLLPPDTNAEEVRRMGAEVAEVEFLDSDGVTVSATLNVDQHGRLFELDVFKTDFSPLLQIPERIV